MVSSTLSGDLSHTQGVAWKGLPYFFGYKMEIFFLSKQSQKSSFILKDGSRSLRLFRTGKTCIIAKLHRTDLAISKHSKEGKTPSYSRINTVSSFQDLYLA